MLGNVTSVCDLVQLNTPLLTTNEDLDKKQHILFCGRTRSFHQRIFVYTIFFGKSHDMATQIAHNIPHSRERFTKIHVKQMSLPLFSYVMCIAKIFRVIQALCGMETSAVFSNTKDLTRVSELRKNKSNIASCCITILRFFMLSHTPLGAIH